MRLGNTGLTFSATTMTLKDLQRKLGTPEAADQKPKRPPESTSPGIAQLITPKGIFSRLSNK